MSNIQSYFGSSNISTNVQKWIISIITGIIAVLIFSPLILQLTNTISQRLRGPVLTTPGGVTGWGLLVHFIVFVLIVRVLMGF